ncbi:MAG: glycosyltransferase family 2 protein [Pseudonocardiaceae bacterium]
MSKSPAREREDHKADRLSVSVVIVTYNSSRVLGGCLDSLPAGLQGVDVTEIVVADNASTDHVVSLAEERNIANLRIVRIGRNAGYSAAINRAVETLKPSDAILVLNPDVRLRSGSVFALADALQNRGVGITVPRLVAPTGELCYSLHRQPTLGRAVAGALLGGDRADRLAGLGERITDPRRYDSSAPAVWATGAVMLISRTALRTIGPWDESFLLYSEETEFALRAADHGWRLWFEAGAEAEHIGGESRTNPMLAALLAVNRVRLYKRRHGTVAGFSYYLAVTFGEALRAAAGRETAQAALGALLFRSRRLRVLPGGEEPASCGQGSD